MNMELLNYALMMLSKRAGDARFSIEEQLAYDSALNIIVAALENKEEVIARIHEAEKYVPLNRLYLSPECGFASCEIGNKLTEEQQWSKLKLVKEIAQEVWPKNVE